MRTNQQVHEDTFRAADRIIKDAEIGVLPKDKFKALRLAVQGALINATNIGRLEATDVVSQRAAAEVAKLREEIAGLNAQAEADRRAAMDRAQDAVDRERFPAGSIGWG